MDRSASYPTTALPSIQTFGRNSSTNTINATPSEAWNTNGTESDMLAYRNWGTEAYSAQHYATTQTDPSLRTNQHDNREQTTWPQQHDEYNASATEHSMYTAGTFTSPPQTLQTPVSQVPPPQPQSYYPQTPTQQNASPTSSVQTVATATAPPPTPSRTQHTYTRTLVGPLSANACRLMDEHRKWGIFFLFQDLSVRTEGPYLSQLFLVLILTS